LAPLVESIALAFVYGSMASGNARAASDVDVMVLGNASFAALVAALAPTQDLLAREVNVTPMRPAEFAGKLLSGDGFALNVMQREKIWLIGTDLDLAELVEDRAAQGTRAHASRDTAAARRGREKRR
jgi:hypothetical protein